MSNDFAAIISATMAALLLLLIAEFQAGVRSNSDIANALADEYASVIKESFFEFCSDRPLAPAVKKHVDQELERYQQLRRALQRHVVWQFAFLAAGVALVVGLVIVILWAAHAELSRGSGEALTVLIITGLSFLVLLGGFLIRFNSSYRFSRLKRGIRQAREYGIPDVSNMQILYRCWEDNLPGGPTLQDRMALLTAHIQFPRIFR